MWRLLPVARRSVNPRTMTETGRVSWNCATVSRNIDQFPLCFTLFFPVLQIPATGITPGRTSSPSSRDRDRTSSRRLNRFRSEQNTQWLARKKKQYTPNPVNRGKHPAVYFFNPIRKPTICAHLHYVHSPKWTLIIINWQRPVKQLLSRRYCSHRTA